MKYQKYLKGNLQNFFSVKIVDAGGKYRHWEKMRFLDPPEGLTNLEWWTATKIARRGAAKTTSLIDKDGSQFKYCITDQMESDLHWIDQNAAGSFESSAGTRDHGKDTYIIRSLVEEAINFSQLEGASTTRHVAKKMIRQRRDPSDISERMIINNYHAMQFIKDNGKEKLTVKIILALHELLADQTLVTEKVGVFRENEDEVYVENNEGELLHMPPDADHLNERMQSLVDFANAPDEETFTHPVIRSIILHFMLGYEHPFVDGNGRTARAVFYWSMKHHSYWLAEYISLSKEIKAAPVRYGQAYRLTETDDGDLTYFIVNQLEMITRAIKTFQSNLAKKMEETQEARLFLDGSDRFRSQLNFRQLSLLKHAIRHPRHEYNISEHKNSHGITYETARQDLLSMAELGLLQKKSVGKKHVFSAPDNMYELLQISENKLDQQSASLQSFFNFRTRYTIE
jgi:Fic family protein